MMSQRSSPALEAADVPAAPCESGSAGPLEKFMSVMLTYLGFNVTKLPATTKLQVVSNLVTYQATGKKPATAATAAKELPCDCRAAFRQTYWTSASRKSMSSTDMTAGWWW